MPADQTHESSLVPWDVVMARMPTRAPADRPLSDGMPTPAGGRDACVALIEAVARLDDLRQAIAVASPSLTRVVDRAEKKTLTSATEADLRRAALSALRYDLRMRTRPTPFGLFAGVAAGRFGPALEVSRNRPDHVRAFPDMGWLLALVRRWQSDPTVFPGLSVQSNTPLVVRGGRVHLDTPAGIGVMPGDSGPAAVRVRLTPAVLDVLRLAERLVPVADLAQEIAARHGGTAADVTGLLRALVQRELLLTDLRPPLNGEDPLDHVRQVLSRAIALSDGDVRGEAAQLDQVADLRAEVEESRSPEVRGPALQELHDTARGLYEHPTPVHADFAFGCEIVLPPTVREEAARAVEVMRRLAPPRLGMRSLRRWHEDFLERYGVGRLVPVLEALDPAVGAGAPGGYEWPVSEAPEQAAMLPIPEDPGRQRRERFLAALVARAQRDSQREIVLSETDLTTLGAESGSPEQVQRSCELYALLVAPDADAVQSGDFRLVVAPNPGSHQAGATFGRFHGLLTPATREALTEAVTAVPAPVAGALQVNLAYQPRSPKAVNIAHAPALTGRRIGIGLITPTTMMGEADIRLDQVAVGATLERIFLVHRPTGRELIPVSSTMLSPGAQAPNVARFLYEAGLEGQRLWEPWDWGPAGAAPFLPRVRTGRVVLCPATWKLDPLRAVAAAGGPAPDHDGWATEIQTWRQDWDVPQHVIVLSSDQRLPLDLADPWHRLLLWDELRGNAGLVAQEMPGGEESPGWLDPDGQGPRPVELVFPMSRAAHLPTAPPAGVRSVFTGPRLRSPGSDWLYARVDTPSGLQDEVLRSRMPALVQELTAAGASSWFFLRYSLPANHLRLRFHGNPAALREQVLPRLSQALGSWREERLVGDWILDAYDPERERYGGPEAQGLAEEVFHQDSRAVLGLLQLLAAPGFRLDADQLATVSIAAIAHAFGPPSDDARWIDPLVGQADPAAAWLSTTGTPKDVPAPIRRRRSDWCDLVDPVGGWTSLRTVPGGPELLSMLAERDEAVARFGNCIRALSAAGRSVTPEVRIVGSLLHMNFNRLIGGPSARERAALAAARLATGAHLQRRRHVS